MKSYSVQFNSNDISQVQGVTLYNYTATDLPKRDIKMFKLARRSLSIITSSEYTDKTIPVYIRVCSGTRQDTEATITDIKGILSAQNGTLELEQSGEQYTYTATMNEFNIEWEGATAWAVIVFVASTPIATAVQNRSLFTFTTSLASDGVSFEVDGSYNAEPITTITLTAVTGGSSASINLFNATTNQGIVVHGNFTSGTIIEINSSTYSVLVNGINTDFEGIFPVFAPGAQRVGYTDTFSTRTVTVTGTYNPQIV